MIFNLAFDACCFLVAANYVSFKFSRIHFHTQNPKKRLANAADAWTANSHLGALPPCYYLEPPPCIAGYVQQVAGYLSDIRNCFYKLLLKAN
jgi:hypothetical protein